jgi:curved DNA-binding protein CbpA
MKNAFATLGLEPRLVIADGEVQDAFREAGRQAHPDAGGSDECFASLREAFRIVSSPSQRLRHWQELHGQAVEIRGVIVPGVMDLFTGLAATSQRAEALARRRDAARSALGRALLEPETQECRETIEQALVSVAAAIERECAAFPGYEAAPFAGAAAVSTTIRNLAFLEKWQDTLRAAFARLV